jgi:predicted dehydrogenase
MKNIAILGCENSHANAFLKLIRDEKKYSDLKVLGVYSEDSEAAKKLSDEFGVAIMENYDSLCGQLDGVIVTARHGANHYKYAKPYIADKIPMFIDKPITIDEDEAVKFMQELKEAGISVCGGSVCVYYDAVVKMKKLVEETASEDLLGGILRAPVDLDNPYGDFFFYSQHLVSMMTEIFGYYPESVFAKKNDRCVDVLVNYGDRNVSLSYGVKNYKYFVGISTKDDYVIEKTAHAADSFDHEFLEFAELLNGKAQPRSYNDFIAPVFILNAISRSMISGKEEKVNKAPKI